jgi:hypothetical protein
VQQNLQTFLQCLTRMPYSGPLFTSQAPFCCIFLMALVSYREEDRRIFADWFDTIVLNVGGRSVCHSHCHVLPSARQTQINMILERSACLGCGEAHVDLDGHHLCRRLLRRTNSNRGTKPVVGGHDCTPYCDRRLYKSDMNI